MFLAAYDGSVTDIPPFPGVSAGIILQGSPKAGDLSLQADVERHGVRTRFDDAVGAGWRLVTNGPFALDRELADWFAGIGGAVVAVGGSAELADAAGAYGTWFTDHAVTAALQRPDFVLFVTAADATQTADLVQSLRDALQSR